MLNLFKDIIVEIFKIILNIWVNGYIKLIILVIILGIGISC